MKLILTKHGITEENIKGIHQGWSPGTLSREGWEQARKLATRLKDMHIDTIYTSDLARSLNTAKEIAKYHEEARFIPDKRLRERTAGTFDGKPSMTGKSDDFSDLSTRAGGGESYKEVWERLKDFYSSILNAYSSETVLAVGHGGSIMLLEGIIRGMPIEDAVKLTQVGPASYTEYIIGDDGKCLLVEHDSSDHLTPG